MLKRILTALALLGLGIGLFDMPRSFVVVTLIIVVFGVLFEAARLTKVDIDRVIRNLLLVFICLPVWYTLIGRCMDYYHQFFGLVPFSGTGSIDWFTMIMGGSVLTGIFYSGIILGSVFWILILFKLVQYQRDPEAGFDFGFRSVFFQILLTVPAIMIVGYSKEIIIYFFVMVCCSDIGALLVGKLCGLHKLASRISPNKTWEGAIGGTISAMLTTAIVGYYLFHDPNWYKFTILALPVSCFAVVGDLFESVLKRKAGIKDSGKLLPGHGGIYDRVDSWISALPIYATAIVMMSEKVAPYDFVLSWI